MPAGRMGQVGPTGSGMLAAVDGLWAAVARPTAERETEMHILAAEAAVGKAAMRIATVAVTAAVTVLVEHVAAVVFASLDATTAEEGAAMVAVAAGTAAVASVAIGEIAVHLGTAMVVVAALAVTVGIAEILAGPGAAAAVVPAAVGSVDQSETRFRLALGAAGSTRTEQQIEPAKAAPWVVLQAAQLG